MINKIFGAVAAIAMAVTPAAARVESGTIPLIELIGSSGIAVRYNSEDCDSGEFLGIYKHLGMKRAFILCPGETVDAGDHMVVRHEAIHAIQHCVNAARGTSIFTPIIDDDAQLMEFVREQLTEEMISEIKRVYPRNHWRIEFEAFAGMHTYSADELMVLFEQACIYTDA